MRESNEEVRTPEDGLPIEGGGLGPPVAKIDFGRRSGVAPLPSHPGNRQGGSDSAPGPPERASRDLGPITNPIILERKRLIQQLTSEMHGMLMVDMPRPGLEVDLDRMMYMYKE